MTEILSSLFKEAKSSEIGEICYLLQGRVAPLYEAIEFGMADKMMIKAVAMATGITTGEVNTTFKREGDLGIVAEKFKIQNVKGNPPACGQKAKLTINEIFEVLIKVAIMGGEGSQDEKINLLGNLIREIDPLSARYVVRIPLNKLRLGFSDMTILDALSWMLCGDKKYRSEIERAYNVRPDLAFIAKTVKEKGMEGLANINPQVGIPIQMTRAERMSSGRDIIDKIGKCAIEPKYDGFRLQVHYCKSEYRNPKSEINLKPKIQKNLFNEEKKDYVKLFSRNLEDVTKMYPDVVAGVTKQVNATEAIFEGEAIGINIKTGQYLPFQETVQRKRKYNVEIKAKEIPLKLFTFDLLFVNGESLLSQSFCQRRKKLEQIVSKGEDIFVAKQDILDDPARIEIIFEDAVSRGLEGVMAKKLDGVYRAGARDFNWIKYKKSYAGKLTDTIDTVVMGYDFGQGKRTSFGIGDFLIGVFDTKIEKFVTVAKIGTGLTDVEWKELKIRSQKFKIDNKPNNYDVDNAMGCDVWMMPKIVVEIRADEITRSPVHTAGRMMGPSKSGNAQEVKVAGFALRFPRLERFRNDKSQNDITTLDEVERMYELQKQK